ncbi:MAG: glycosyltransferase [Planctomycetota bacterium]|nr:glycosyltransferase [Planctomycetota bacterium]
MFNRVLILSASAGAGHVRAAQALEAAFKLRGAAREVRHVDTLDYTSAVFRNLYSRAYLEMVKRAPEMLGWFYDRMDKPYKNQQIRESLNKLNTKKFVQLIEEFQPDIAVCTHFLPSEIISWLKEKGRLTCPLVQTVTDLDVHAMWLCRHCDHYFVAMDETRAHLEKLGVGPDKITVTGIPIDPDFATPYDKAKARKELGLAPDVTTILLSAGGFGVGPVENLVASLADLRHPAQIVAICGRNEALEKRMHGLQAKFAPAPKGHVTLRVVGFTKEMDRFMAAADLLLGKPGGLTTSEALARGLGIVVVNPIPGQEERNSDHLLEEGAAIRCNNLPALAFKIDRLLDDPQRLAAMRANVRRIARPNAALDVVDALAKRRG